MTSIRQSIRRLLGGQVDSNDDPIRPYYSYRIYWTKLVRDWSNEKRQNIAEKLEQVVSTDEFEPNPLERRYSVEGLSANKHAGASLLALQEVLHGFQEFDRESKEKDNE